MEDSAGIDKKKIFSEANNIASGNMHRVIGGGPLLLQRRAEVMDAYRLLQHNHPALPPSLHDFQVCCLTDLLAVSIENMIIAGRHRRRSC